MNTIRNISKTYVIEPHLVYKTVVLLVMVYSSILGQSTIAEDNTNVVVGLDVLLNSHLGIIRGHSIALVTNKTKKNQSDRPNYERLMLLEDVELRKIFVPEYGLLGKDSSNNSLTHGQQMEDLPEVISLYGDVRKPTPEMLQGITLVLYDIQDIGARNCTYLSTLGFVMEAAGELQIPVVILDRPNPLGGEVVEGPTLKTKFKLTVSSLPIPMRYGMTVGELSKMIVGENGSILPQK